MELLFPFILMFAVAYFLIFRPQKKQQQQKVELMNALKIGMSVITVGGLHGVISDLNKTEKTVTLDCEGIYLTFEEWAVQKVNHQTEPVAVEKKIEEDSSPLKMEETKEVE